MILVIPVHFRLLLTLLLACVGMLPALHAQAIVPETKVNLLDGSIAFVTHLSPKSVPVHDAPEVFVLDEGALRVTGEGFGYFRTPDAYRDYHLVLEYKWGEHTWGNREDRARDSGILFHAHGEDGSFGGAWIPSIEAQLAEGGSGNFQVLPARLPDGTVASEVLTGEVAADPNGEPFWKEGGESKSFPEGKSRRLGWSRRDPDWENTKGFRGKEDVESPIGDWNRLELICEGSRVEVRLNGIVVNKALEVAPAEGFIGLQSEGAELFIRRLELWPLGKFTEPFEVAGDNAKVKGVIESRRLPLSAEESMSLYEIDGDFELELVAAEPLVCDPVDVAFDAQGRLYVAEMRDYPLPPEEGPLLSRIRLLTDEDGDGRMDKAVNWATELDHVQGMLPMRGGLLVTTRIQVLFLKDTDGDGVADEKKILLHSNEPRHSQLQVSCPRWGLDNHIYLNNGLDGNEIYPEGQPEQKLKFAQRNLKFDPVTGKIEAVTGRGQFGATLDDWGRRFFCSNRNPTMFAVMPLHAMERNPYAGITQGHEDIALEGGNAVVYPVSLTHTTSDVHHGTHTAACGLGIYRGDLMPELKGNVFVCEPPGQLITRARIAPHGASLRADRVRIGKRTEFIRSADEWSRPVNIRNGPDGALYFCDMYRRYIDHARFFPEEYLEKTYMRSGFDHGRIYRVVPKDWSPKTRARPLPSDVPGLVETLKHPNAWHRETAQRLLMEKGDDAVVPALEEMLNDNDVPAQARAHALWSLVGLGKAETPHALAALADPNAGVVENAIQFAERFVEKESLIRQQLLALLVHEDRRVRFLAAIALGKIQDDSVTEALAGMVVENPEDIWIRRAVLSGSEKRAGKILESALMAFAFPEAPAVEEEGAAPQAEETAPEDADAEAEAEGADPGGEDAGPEFAAPGPGRAELIRELAGVVAARGDLEELQGVFAALGAVDETRAWWQNAAITGLADGLRRHDGELGHKQLGSLLRSPPAELAEVVQPTKAFLDDAMFGMINPDASLEDRLAAIPLLGHMTPDKALAAFGRLIAKEQAAEIQEAAFAAMQRFDRVKLADLFFGRWEELGPIPRREALALLTTNAKTQLLLLQKMKSGVINPALMDSMSRWKFGRSKNPELKKLADELWGQPSADRQQVLEDYREALAMEADPVRGHAVFMANCFICHKVDGEGNEVGPDISDVRNKLPEALLSDILDPNRMMEARWLAYSVVTVDDRTLAGLIASESAAGIELRGPGLSETIARAEIESMASLEQSLMPVGLEGAISKQQMADLLAFLRER